MTIYSEILKHFNTFENQFYFEAKNCFKVLDLPEFGFFKTVLDQAIPSRDTVIIIMTNDSDEQFIFRGESVCEYNRFLSETDEVDVLIKIDKNVKGGYFSIYNFESFVEHLLEIKFIEQLEFFSSLLSGVEERLFFQIFDESFKDKEYATSGFTFVYHNSEPLKIMFNRKNSFRKIEFTNSFYDFNKFKLLPNDFHIVLGDFGKLSDFLTRTETMFAIIYLSSFALLQNDVLKLSILSTKLVTESYNTDDIEYKPELFEVYNWIYSEDNYLDKLVVVKHELESSKFNFQTNTINSNDIIRIYNLYIGQKSSDFLKAKADMGTFLLEKIFEMYQYKNVILGNLINNFFALVAFLLTTIIANIVSASPLDNIFTDDILWLLLFISLGSYGYCYFSNLRFKSDIKDFEKVFKRLQNNYVGVFSDLEMREIFQTSEFSSLKDDLQTYKLKVNIIWLISITFLIVWVILMLCKSNNFWKMSEVILCEFILAI